MFNKEVLEVHSNLFGFGKKNKGDDSSSGGGGSFQSQVSTVVGGGQALLGTMGGLFGSRQQNKLDIAKTNADAAAKIAGTQGMSKTKIGLIIGGAVVLVGGIIAIVLVMRKKNT